MLATIWRRVIWVFSPNPVLENLLPKRHFHFLTQPHYLELTLKYLVRIGDMLLNNTNIYESILKGPIKHSWNKSYLQLPSRKAHCVIESTFGMLCQYFWLFFKTTVIVRDCTSPCNICLYTTQSHEKFQYSLSTKK